MSDLPEDVQVIVARLGSSPEAQRKLNEQRLATLGEVLEQHHRRFVQKVREAIEREETGT